MWRLMVLLLLTTAGRTLADGAPTSVERRLSASPAFFSFQPLAPANGVMASLLESLPALALYGPVGDAAPVDRFRARMAA